MKPPVLTVSSLLVALLAPAATCAATPSPRVPPSQDPFYTAPAHFERFSPGEVLRIHTAPSSAIPNCSAAYHILYRTTDTRYRPSWAVTTLLLPAPYSTSQSPPGRPLLSYQIPYNSPDIDASPSFDQSAMAVPGGPIASALGRGWLVVVPDFEGPTASFGAGVQAGHATVDSVRAVLSLSAAKKPPKNKKLELGPISRYAMWGYSGGSIATEFAAELAVRYAPELVFAGAAIGGVVPNITDLVPDRLNRTPYVGDLFAILVGVVNQYPEAYDFLVGSLKEEGPYNRTGFLAVKGMTILEAFAFYAGQDIWSYFVQGIEVVRAPVIRKVLQRNSVMGYHGVPEMPLFVYQAIGDRFSPIEETDALVERYCRIGASITFERNAVGGHLAEIVNGLPRALAWLARVLEGTMGPRDGCDIRTVSVNITDIGDGF